MSSTVATPATHVLEWLGIALTPGLGPTKARKLVEHFGSVEGVFRASLTELESTGIQAVSAQSMATGKSAELAREEVAKASAAGVTIVSGEDLCYPPRLKEIYDPPLVLYVRGNPEVLIHLASRWWARVTPLLTGQAWRNGWHATWRRRVWSLLVGWRGESIRRAIAGLSQRKAKRSPCLARG